MLISLSKQYKKKEKKLAQIDKKLNSSSPFFSPHLRGWLAYNELAFSYDRWIGMWNRARELSMFDWFVRESNGERAKW